MKIRSRTESTLLPMSGPRAIWLPIPIITSPTSPSNSAVSRIPRPATRLRSAHPTLNDGKLQSIAPHGNALRCQRVDANQTLHPLLNPSHEPVQVDDRGIILK